MVFSFAFERRSSFSEILNKKSKKIFSLLVVYIVWLSPLNTTEEKKVFP